MSGFEIDMYPTAQFGYLAGVERSLQFQPMHMFTRVFL